MIPAPLERLIKTMSRLPGLGPRSASRAALHLLQKGEQIHTLQQALADVAAQIKTCQKCGNIGLEDICHICTDVKREPTICVVEGVDDLWALERSAAFNGKYHVLGGVVSALDGITPEDLNMASLMRRVEEEKITEVILALGASVDGQTTSHLISRQLKALPNAPKISALAKGIPMGAQVDYLDDGTLALALSGRQSF